MRRSPISTVILEESEIHKVIDGDIRRALVLRILRYVSPFPWGSPRAEVGRRKENITEIIKILWSGPRRRLAAGSGVFWTPIILHASGTIKFTSDSLQPGCAKAWLVTRQPPPISNALADPALKDITDSVRRALVSGSSLELMYDNRFRVDLRVDLLPRHIRDEIERGDTEGKIMIIPWGPFCLPRVIWRTNDEDCILVSAEPSGKIIVSPQLCKIEGIRSLDADLPWPTLQIDSLLAGKHIQ